MFFFYPFGLLAAHNETKAVYCNRIEHGCTFSVVRLSRERVLMLFISRYALSYECCQKHTALCSPGSISESCMFYHTAQSFVSVFNATIAVALFLETTRMIGNAALMPVGVGVGVCVVFLCVFHPTALTGIMFRSCFIT